MAKPKCVQVGNATLYLGDCLEILPTLAPVDAVIADPPYSSGGTHATDRMASTRAKYTSSDAAAPYALPFAGDNRDQRSWHYWMTLWLGSALRLSQPGAMLCVFSDWRQLPTATDAIQAGGWIWRGVAVWNKVNCRPMPDRFRQTAEFIAWGTNGPRAIDKTQAVYHDGVHTALAPSHQERRHATEKPVELMRKLVRVAKHQETVLDPFMGSGTTGVACANLGRRFVGIEIEPRYFDIAVERTRKAYKESRETEALHAE